MDNTSPTVNNATNITVPVDDKNDQVEPLTAAVIPPAQSLPQDNPAPEITAPQLINPNTGTSMATTSKVAEPGPAVHSSNIVPTGVAIPEVAKPAPGPSLFGYKPPTWANDFDYIRKNRGKGTVKDSDAWALLVFDRLLKKHS